MHRLMVALMVRRRRRSRMAVRIATMGEKRCRGKRLGPVPRIATEAMGNLAKNQAATPSRAQANPRLKRHPKSNQNKGKKRSRN